MSENTAVDPERKTRWKAGTVIGMLGLVGFVVLGLVLVIGMFAPDSAVAAFSVGLFPWALGSLAVGIVGIAIAGFHRPSDPGEDGGEGEGEGVLV